MLVDGISLIEGSNITNLVVPAGTNFPASPDIGELFYKTGANPGLYVYDGAWTLSGGSGIVTEADVEDGSILARVASNETITGTWTYTNPVTAANPTAVGHLTTKSYVDSEIDGIIAGSANQVQFNAAGSFGASADLTFNDTSNVLRVGANLTNGTLVVSTGGLITNGLAGDSMGTTSMTIRPVITSSGNGSNVSIVGGDVSSGTSVSGSVFITGGGASSTGANSGLFGPNGAVNIAGGPGHGTYPHGGPVNISGGSGNYAAGWVTLSGGTGTAGGGGIVLYTAPTTTQAERLRIANNGAWGLGGANYGTAGQVLTSAGSGAAPSWASPVINTAITLTTAAQPNVTSVGALTSLSVTGNISAGGNITAAEPTLGSQVTTKSYVDNLLNGLSWKTSVRVATTANITLSGTQTIDSTALVVGDRVLVKNQTNATQNGVYVVAAGAWTRATDFDASPSAGEVNGAAVFVRDGGTNADTAWTQTLNVVDIGADPLAFTIFSATGGAVARTGDTMTGALTVTMPDGTNSILTLGSTVGGMIALRPDGTNGSAIRIGGSGAGASIFRLLGPSDTEYLRVSGGELLVNRTTSSGLGRLQVAIDSGSSVADFSASSGSAAVVRVRATTLDSAYTFYQNSATGTGLSDGLQVGIDSTSKAYFANNEAGAISLQTSGVERVHIAAAGNVGIGREPSALARLDVQGTGQSLVRIRGGGGTSEGGGFYVTVAGSDTTAMAMGNPQAIVGGAASPNAMIWSSGDLISYVGNGERMRIAADGKVGVGTTNLLANFNVAGTIRADNGNVTATPLILTGGLSNFQVRFGAGEAICSLINSADGSFSFGTGTVEQMRIASSGVVTVRTELVTPGLRVTGSAIVIGSQGNNAAIAVNASNQAYVRGALVALQNVAATANYLEAGPTGIFDGTGNELGWKNIPPATNTWVRGGANVITAGATIGGSNAGDVFSVYNNSANSVTLTPAGGVTLRLGGTTATGARTLLPYGFATIWYQTGSVVVINGNVT